MKTAFKLHGNSYLIGGLRFGFASIFASIFVWILLQGRLFAFIRDQIPEEQLFIRLLAGILAIVIAYGIFGAIIGLVGGDALSDMNRQLSKNSSGYKLAVVMGLANAVAVLPMVVLFIFLTYYNAVSSPARYSLIFAAIAILYGLIFNLIFLLFYAREVERLKYLGRSMLGFVGGGAAAGFVFWLSSLADMRSLSILRCALMILALFLFYAVIGTAITYGVSVSKKSAKKITRPLYSYILLATFIVIVSFVLLSNLSKISTFLYMRDAGLSEQLAIDTKESGWELYENPAATDEIFEIFHKASLVASGDNRDIACVGGNLYIDEEQIDLPSCISDPYVITTADERTHLIWVSDQYVSQNRNMKPREMKYIYESVSWQDKWSEPYLISYGDEIVLEQLRSDGGIYLEWKQDGSSYIANQPSYRCDPTQLSRLDRTLYDAISQGGFYSDDSILPYCQNSYDSIAYLPNPVAESSRQPESMNGSFDQMATLAESARYEVLFTTMEWVTDADGLSPGKTLTDSIATLYEKVKANPEKYPRGMKVRILLGNYPEVNNFTWGQQIFNVLEDLHSSGMYRLVDEEIGWEVEVANFDGTWPHGHTKFIVVDGREVIAAGYNYSYLHFDINHPSRKGLGMADMGLHIKGPVAQASMAAYDDLWNGSDMIVCSDYQESPPVYWEATCTFKDAKVSHIPEVTRFYPTESDDISFSLFRNEKFKEADIAVDAAIGSATESIDLFHVNFSLLAICDAGILLKDYCDFDQALPWMKTMVDTIEQEDVKVRIMVEKEAMNGMENRIGIKVMYDELRKRGIEDNVEVKFFEGKMHSKSTLIDDQLLIIGSQNMHYSSWGKSGLTEYSLSSSSPVAVEDFKETFDFYWERGIPAEQLMVVD